ncbi:hypothetical protein Droror1_Dr00022063 [Drosera rotundifolia]
MRTFICYLLSSLLFSLYNSRGSNSFVIPENETVPALIVFGDSIVDPGNSDRLDTICRADHPPYGRDFEGGKATGRFSNAKIPTDYLADALGIKDLLPAYFDPTIKTEDLLTGVSFAFACCGYDPLTPQTFHVPSLQDQLEYFKEYKKKLIAAVGEERTSFIVSKSIYVVAAGSNDFTFTYNLFKLRQEMNMSSYTELMISQASVILQALYDLGARRIGALSLPPEGCLPASRTFFGSILRFCVEEYNYYSMVFNIKLQLLMFNLREKNPDSRFVYLDLYNQVLRLVQNPTESGFQISNVGCCATGTSETSIFCNSLFDLFSTCKNESEYVFWDAYHPTDKANKIIVEEVFGKVINDFF